MKFLSSLLCGILGRKWMLGDRSDRKGDTHFIGGFLLRWRKWMLVGEGDRKIIFLPDVCTKVTWKPMLVGELRSQGLYHNFAEIGGGG